MQFQNVQEPVLLKHCSLVSSELASIAKAGTTCNLELLLEKSMFDLATDLILGFNPDTLHTSATSQLYADWALVNDAAFLRQLTKDVPYWNFGPTKTRYHASVESARDRIDLTIRGYVERCHTACTQNPSKQPTSAMEYYFLTPKEEIIEMTDEQVVQVTLNLVWGAADSTKCVICLSSSFLLLY